MDFGGLKRVKEYLTLMFDHTVLIACDDPSLDDFKALHQLEIISLRVVDSVGCESFAKMIFEAVQPIVYDINPLVGVFSVEVFEHGANSAVYIAP